MNAFRIYWYATASTSSAAYILGGYFENWVPKKGGRFEKVRNYYSTIAEYKNNKWSKFGDLQKKRYGHSAIFFNEETIIVGGIVEDDGR